MALIDCPECYKRISESALGCPNCGFMLTRDVVAAQKEEEAKSRQLKADAARCAERREAIWAGVVVAVIALVVGVAIFDPTPAPSYTPHWSDGLNQSETSATKSSPWLRNFSDKEKETILQESYLFDAAAKQLENERGD